MRTREHAYAYAHALAAVYPRGYHCNNCFFPIIAKKGLWYAN